MRKLEEDVTGAAATERERLKQVSILEIDYLDLKEQFSEITQLLTQVTGVPMALINIIDSTTQWTIGNTGMDICQVPREESICQYTILQDTCLEIPNMLQDERFKDKAFVLEEPHLRYYYGVPLATDSGSNIGALCLLHTEPHKISTAEQEILQTISKEIVQKLRLIHQLKAEKNRGSHLLNKHRTLAHDLRNPLAGIMGLCSIIKDPLQYNMEEIKDLTSTIEEAATSLLQLTDSLLKQQEMILTPVDLNVVKQTLLKLYTPQADSKEINLTIYCSQGLSKPCLPQDQLIQIAGNLISNSIKFSESGATVKVDLKLLSRGTDAALQMQVVDHGVGMTVQQVNNLLIGNAISSTGSKGERGYGIGFSLIMELTQQLGGTLSIESQPEEGTKASVNIPCRLAY